MKHELMWHGWGKVFYTCQYYSEDIVFMVLTPNVGNMYSWAIYP